MADVIKIALVGDVSRFSSEMIRFLGKCLEKHGVVSERFMYPSGAVTEKFTLDSLTETLCRMSGKREEMVSELETSGKKSVLFCTSTELDLLDTIHGTMLGDFFGKTGLDTVRLRDVPYDAVFSFGKGFHMPSESWIGHPHLRLFDVSKDFDFLCNSVWTELKIVLGIPKPLEMERKFLVVSVGEIPCSRTCEIYQTYIILPDGEKSRIRARGENGSFLYFQTTKEDISDVCRKEEERRLTRDEYLELLTLADPQKRTIHKLRTCFAYHNQYFELDTFLAPSLQDMLLETELSSEEQRVDLPPFVKIVADVTAEKKYHNSQIAKKENFHDTEN